jgi:cAMP phosphodiesterase
VPIVIYAFSLHLGRYTKIHSSISVLPMRLSHGTSSRNPRKSVLSTAFFLRHDPTQREILFFGDVEPDTLSLDPMNVSVWRTAAPKIPHALSAIFLECSWTSERSDDELYGHLSPSHLLDELLVLATEVWRVRTLRSSGRSLRQWMKVAAGKAVSNPSPSSEELRGILDGLTVHIIHCKSDLTSERPARYTIEKQIKDLMQKKGLGANFLVVEQGSVLHV